MRLCGMKGTTQEKLIELAAKYGHSNESCPCPCGHEKTCEECGFYGQEPDDKD